MNIEPEARKTYDQILAQAARLDRHTQMELLLDLAAQLRRSGEAPIRPKHSLGKLQGLFKGVWGGRTPRTT
jgi:hypothetical protein